jgi:RNA polymerase sigma factor (TIGR02999 family)
MAMLSSKGVDVIAFPEPRPASPHPAHARQGKSPAHVTVVPYDSVAATDRRRVPARPLTHPASRALQVSMKPRTLTSLFESAERGDAAAAEALFAALYNELHRMARRELSGRRGSVTIGVTTLLHEAYIKMSDRDGIAFPDRARFMAYAARVMRGLIIDDVRRRRSEKRGGLFDITSLGTHNSDSAITPQSLLLISDALDELAAVEPDLAEIVDLKFFCGFSFAEIAAMRGVSERTIQRNWEKGRLYLHYAIGSAGRTATSANAAAQS